jgi:DNA-binding CsgD family transcriptional regulator
MRAAAEIAEVARARRDRSSEQAAIGVGTELWASLQPILVDARARQHGQDAEETAADVATIEAERRRLNREAAAASWLDAGDRWRARENPYLLAYCRWREAEALLGDGDRASAATALREAHRIATRLDARPLRTAVEALAARSRLDVSAGDSATRVVPAATHKDPFGLTRRERDVLPLLVKGRTNRQIAAELFISENTAGVHVSNILGKLGASTRTEAAGIAARLGLGSD